MWIAIVERDENDRVQKYEFFTNEFEANQHVAAHGGSVLPYDVAYDIREYTVKNNGLKHDPIAPVYIDKDVRFNDYLGNDIFVALKDTLFELLDRLDALEGKNIKTQGEKDAWIKSKMIGAK